jgi:hypothetical protein
MARQAAEVPARAPRPELWVSDALREDCPAFRSVCARSTRSTVRKVRAPLTRLYAVYDRVDLGASAR